MKHCYRPRFVFVLVLLSVLSACQRQGTDAASQDGAAANAAPEPASAVSSVLSLEPASLTTCNDTVATVKWNVQAEHPGVTDVEIWVGYGTESKLWQHSSAQGEAKTDQWTHPGATFILKNKADGTELARAVMQGPKCD